MATLLKINAADHKHSVRYDASTDPDWAWLVIDPEGNVVGTHETKEDATEEAHDLTTNAIEDARHDARVAYEAELAEEAEEEAETLRSAIAASLDGMDLKALRSLAKRIGA